MAPGIEGENMIMRPRSTLDSLAVTQSLRGYWCGSHPARFAGSPQVSNWHEAGVFECDAIRDPRLPSVGSSPEAHPHGESIHALSAASTEIIPGEAALAGTQVRSACTHAVSQTKQ